MNKYGSFMWFGIHMGVTQVDWHWFLEILFLNSFRVENNFSDL
jgi:hypothetical protein